MIRLSPKKEEIFRKKIVGWGKRNYQDFPWRKEIRTPYEIFLVEMFLKRTTSSHVIKIYSGFINKYQTFKNIIDSDPQELEAGISSLGLQNQRVKLLKKASKFILDNYNGKIPKGESKLRKIPGVGQYAARAIQCFAFNIRSYPIDSNMKRIFARVFLDKEWKEVKELEIEALFKDTQPFRHFKEFNYYLLDFGSMVCRAAHPKCQICPVDKICNYYYKE